MTDHVVPDHLVAGSGKTTVFLLHGGYGSKDYWKPEIETLVKAGYRVVAWDAPGYGISPLPATFTIESLAAACVRLIWSLAYPSATASSTILTCANC